MSESTSPQPQPSYQAQYQAQQQPQDQPQAQLQIQPQPQSPESAPAELTYHVHNSYIWLESIRLAVILLFVLIVSSIGSVISFVADGEVDGVFAGGLMFLGLGFFFLVVIGICFLSQWLSYKHLYYSLGPDEFSLYKGIFNKQRIHVPYARIQSVDKRAQLLQRIFGVCSINIDTAGGENNKAIVVPYVTKAQADWLIQQLYARKMANTQPAQAAAYAQIAPSAQATYPSQPAATPQAASTTAPINSAAPQAPSPSPSGNILDVGDEAWNQFGGIFAGSSASAPFETVRYQYGLSNKELFLSGLSNNTAFAAIVISVICVVLQVFGFLTESFPTETNNAFDSFSQFAFSASIIPAIAGITVGIIGVLIVIWLLSAVGTCIGYGGFKARRYADRIEVEHGLLQHTSMSVSIERIQAVVIKQTFIRRLIGYCELSLDKVDAASDNSSSSDTKNLNRNGLVVHPFVKRSKVDEILAGLLPEYSEAPTKETPVARVALRRGLIRRCIWQGGGFWLAIITVITQLILNAIFAPQAALSTDAFNAASSLLDSTATLSGAEAAEVMQIAFDYSEAQFAVWIINTIAIGLYIIAGILLIIEAISTIFWARESGFAYTRRFMRITNGGLSRETRTLPKQKIQFGFTRTNPFQRMANTATINISTAAGLGTQNALIDVEKEEALRWLEWLKPGT